jgi:hypothetical protein
MQSIVALLLVLFMAGGVLPPPARAADAEPSVGAEQVRVSGDSSLGTLLGEEIDAANLMSVPTGGSGCVTDLTLTGDTASVSCQTNRDSQLVVAVYEEESGKMTASGLAAVTPQESTAAVKLEGEIPAYFTASAYLLDPLTHEPLSTQFTTRQYTAEMQAFLRKTTEDFAPEQVVNLDGDRETNFGVLGEETRTVEQAGSANRLQDNGETYTVTRADDAFTTLNKGDTVSYTAADGSMTLIKVKKIQVSGNTVTITPDTDADLSDFFDYLKIEADTEGCEPRWDNSDLDEGVTAIPGPSTMAEGETSGKVGQSFEVKLEDKVNDRVKGSVTLKLDVTVKGTVKYYLVNNYKQVDLTIDLSLGASIAATGKVSAQDKRLGRVELPTSVPGVKIGFTPSVVGEVSGALEWDGTIKTTIGGGFDTVSGFRSLCKKPSTESVIKLKAELFVGVKGTPYVAIIDSELAKATLEMSAGLRIQGEESTKDWTDDTVQHDCAVCIEGTVAPVFQVTYGVDIVKDWLTKKQTFTFELDKQDWYYSVDRNQFAIGSTCPYRRHQVKVTVQDPLGSPVKGVRIQNTGLASDPKTDENGVATFFLPDGVYPFYAYDADTDCAAERDAAVYKSKREVTLNLAPREYDVAITVTDENGQFLTGATVEDTGLAVTPRTVKARVIDPVPFASFRLPRGKYNLTVRYGDLSKKVPLAVTTADWGKPISLQVTLGKLAASGTCGKNLKWEETQNGTLTIRGSGEMTDYSTGDAPWWEHPIKQVVIEEGVTSIGDYAFYGSSLTKVTIPDSMRRIGRRAFGLSKLESVTIPDGVTSMKEEVFQSCENLTSAVLPQGITEITYGMFDGCGKLDSVHIPEGVTKIGDSAFSACESLPRIHLPKGVTSIGNYAFARTAVTGMDLPDGLTELGEGAFAWTPLKSISIPKGVPQLGYRTFFDCKSLETVQLSDGLGEIGYEAFRSCEALKMIFLPDTVTTIDELAFCDCDQMTYILVGSGVRMIGGSAFECGSGNLQVWFRGDFPSNQGSIFQHYTVASVYYPADNPTWEALKSVNLGEYFGYSVSFHPYRPDGDEPQEPDKPQVENSQYTSDLSDDGTVTIRGTGEMRRWTEEDMLSYPPWYCEPELAAKIKKAIIEKGATTVGESTFYNCVNLTDVSIPEGVKKIDAMAFAYCSSLPTVALPEGLTAIGINAFWECSALEEVRLPDSVTELGDAAFQDCTSLHTVKLSRNLTEIEKRAFSGCTGFNSCYSLDIPERVAEVRSFAFGNCGELHLVFQGNAPDFEEFAFSDSQVRAFYPADDPTWADFAAHPEDHQYDGTVTWIPNYTFSTPEQPTPTNPFENISGEFSGGGGWTSFGDSGDTAGPTLLSAFTGTESDAGGKRTASFKGLAPGAEYLFAAVKNRNADPLLGAGNLLYIAQGTADETGSLSFSYPLEETAQTVAFGASGNNLRDAVVTAGKLTYNGRRQAAQIAVTYDGVRLTEGVDYLLSGDLSAVNAGSYTVTVTGLGDYAGTVAKSYTVGKCAAKITAASVTKSYSPNSLRFQLGAKTSGDGALTYQSGNTKVAKVSKAGKVTLTGVGKTTVTITAAATGNYKKATKKITVTVKKPAVKAPSISKLTNGKGKKLTVKWKKVSGVTGYEVQYSRDKKFKKGVKKVTVKKAGTTSATVKKLTKKKTYHVRVRAYLTVNKSTFRSEWSGVKSVKIKQ